MTKGRSSLSLFASPRQAVRVSMYLQLLRGVLDDWVDELEGPALIDYAVMCRSATARSPQSGDVAHVALAAEISYDRALIKLCTASGIEVDVMAFSHPFEARSRLERELAALGTDLVALSKDYLAVS
jgi:hypothetical protein